MHIKETLTQDLKHEFDVTIPASDIERDMVTHLERIGKKVKIPGFRPGKVPLPLLKQRYKAEALKDVIESCADKSIKKIVEDNGFKPSLKPNVTLKEYEEGKDLILSISLEILPTIGDINLEGFSFEKYVVKVPSKRVEEVLEMLAKQNREGRPLQKPRKSKKGDIVIIDFKGFVDGEPIERGEGVDYSLELGSDSFIPGFEDQLIGAEKGEAVEVKVTFPKEYQDARYANKPARFDVKLKDIHEVDAGAIDTALAKKLGFDSLEALKEKVENNLSHEYVAQSFMNTKRQVLDALAERFVFDVPHNMVDLELDNIWSQLLEELGIDRSKAANIDGKTFKEATGKEEKELRKDYEIIAERRVRLGILLAEIGNRHKLAVSQQELIDALTARAREFPGQEREVFDYYRNNESALATLRVPLFENKVVEFILSHSKIKEIPATPAELEKVLLREEETAAEKISTKAKKMKPHTCGDETCTH